MDPRALPPAPADLLPDVLERERALHCPDAATPREAFEAGVVEPYWEVGASGGRFDVDVIWDVVRRRAAGDPSAYGELGADPGWVTAEEELRVLAPGVYLLTYLLTQGYRRTRRCTIWRHAAGENATDATVDTTVDPTLDPAQPWVACYHQGTVVTGRW